MSTLIVYYSMGGNTAWAAERMAERIGADTLRLEPVKAYPDKGVRKFLRGGKSAVMAERPVLKHYSFVAEKYDRIIFGVPVWAGNMAPPLRTFKVPDTVVLSAVPPLETFIVAPLSM